MCATKKVLISTEISTLVVPTKLGKAGFHMNILWVHKFIFAAELAYGDDFLCREKQGIIDLYIDTNPMNRLV